MCHGTAQKDFFDFCATGNGRPWKDHFKSDLRSDQDHRQKKDLR
jgi:hypothetical protein